MHPKLLHNMKKTILIFIFNIIALTPLAYGKTYKLLNVSYDPTRELYSEINEAFTCAKQSENIKLQVNQSHGASGKQALSIVNGLKADIVSLALAYDIDMIARAGYIDPKWRDRAPNQSSPYGSIIVFLVRKGNPRNIKDWDDLIKDDIKIITPNPKTSGGARFNYIAAWRYFIDKYDNEDQAIEFVRKLYQNVPVLDTAARTSTISFTKRGMGDVLIAWENEAFLAMNEMNKGDFEVVIPSSTIYINLPVTIVDKVVDKQKTRDLAGEYINFLYSDIAQEIIAKNYYRPVNKEIFEKRKIFAKVKSVDSKNLDWDKIQIKHFSNDGIFDQLYNTTNTK